MTREEYENERYVDALTERYHARTGKRPNKEEAMRAIRENRRAIFFPPRPQWGEEAIRRRSYARSTATELLRRIEESNEVDPIRVIYSFWSFLDDMVCLSEHSTSWMFASTMRDITHDIMELL